MPDPQPTKPVPDYMMPLVAYRCWSLEPIYQWKAPRHLVLRPLTYTSGMGFEWTPRQVMVASHVPDISISGEAWSLR